VDGVNSSASAGITASWASRSRGSLGRSIRDRVASSTAAALECVVKSEPVTNLVGGGVTFVIVGLASAGNCRAQDAASIVVEIVATSGGRDWEVAVSQIIH